MKIVIPGGSGQVGGVLARVFAANGHEVVILSREGATRGGAPAAPWRTVAWDGETLGPWARQIDGADVVINLAGRTVNCRYTKAHLKEMMDSRVLSTRVVGQAIAQAARPPRVWLQASTATIYAHRYDAANDERTGIIGGGEPGAPRLWDKSIEIAKAWEAECLAADTPRTRRVLLRSAMTMSPDAGGIFDALLGLVRKGLGGSAGDGRQYVSWIHHADFTRAIEWLIGREDVDGAVNLCSPHPLPYREFMRDLRAAAGVRVGLPATRWMLAIGTWLMRTETELVLKSRRVAPARLLDAGFVFRFPRWPDAARDLCASASMRREAVTPPVAAKK